MPPVLNITIPVFNEEKALAQTVHRVSDFLAGTLAHDWEIVIASNGSTDSTPDIACSLQKEIPNVRTILLSEKGRGFALKRAWTESRANVLTYMDCDLSTDLNCFPSLVAPILNGHSDISIGSRLLSSARTVRGLKRSVISKSYNRLVRSIFHVSFSDAQCGFKAISRKAFLELQPLVQDNGWFMDTELLLIAEAAGYRIFDLPVSWVDDPDSKVKIISSILDHLKGLFRVKRRLIMGEYNLPSLHQKVANRF